MKFDEQASFSQKYETNLQILSYHIESNNNPSDILTNPLPTGVKQNKKGEINSM